ncbi:hypothetical protein [Amycolatopsis sacchari]|uniref:hypothetical protein n=1 Tax=Amycolatopsis sacchari TaxID=115433 RepID=UPI003D72390E
MSNDERRDWSPAERAEYRRFVRTHHPDVGGDPEVFAAGLRRFAERSDRGGAPIVFVPTKRGLPRLVAALAARRRRQRRTRVL